MPLRRVGLSGRPAAAFLPPCLALALLLPGGATPAASADAASSTTTARGQVWDAFATVVSDRDDDLLGAGADEMWRWPQDPVEVSGTPARITVQAGSGTSSLFLRLTAPTGGSLKAGSYVDTAYAPQPHRAGLRVDVDGHQCTVASGRFQIIDITPDLSRLWVVYEQHCQGARPATFGEIEKGEPLTGPSVVPDRVAWPEDYPDVALREVPVRISNPESTAFVVRSARIVAGGADFSVLGDDCSSVVPYDWCTVTLGFRPSVAGTRLGMLRVVTSRGDRWVPLSGRGTSGLTSWQMQSAPGDWVGDGLLYDFTPAGGARITASGSTSLVFAHVSQGVHEFDADFQAPPGQDLVAGRTYQATRYPFNTGAGMDVSGDHRGCNTLSGSFTVDDVAHDRRGALRRFSISFVQNCETSDPPLTGTIDYRVPDPDAPAADLTPPRPVGHLSGSWRDGRLHLAWVNPTSADWVDTVVRGARGGMAPASADAGSELSTGRGSGLSTAVRVRRLYTVAVFTRDRAGNVSRGSTLTVRNRG